MTRLHTTLLALASVSALACSRPDALYCDEETPCTDPSRPYCDLAGDDPASGGVGHTCIGEPTDGGSTPDANLECSTSDTCPASNPRCEDNTCSRCELGSDGDALCADRGDGLPYCGAMGGCVECAADEHCSESEPVCSSGVCSACTSNGQCDSGLCDTGSGECIAAARIVYVDGDAGSDSPSCGDAPGSAACEKLGGPNGGVAKLGGARDQLLMTPGIYTEPTLTIDGIDATMHGSGATFIHAKPAQAPAIEVTGGSDLSIVDLTIKGAEGFTNGHGISCVASTLSLGGVLLTENQATGVFANTCVLTLRDSVARKNGTGVRSIATSTLRLVASELSESTRHGLLADNSVVEVERSIVSANDGGGINLESSSFVLENNFITRNGDLSSSPGRTTGAVVVTNAAGISPQVLRHNTLVDNRAPQVIASAGLICATGSPVTAASNIVFDNDLANGPDPSFSGNCSFSYSLVEGIGAGNGNLSATPNFVSGSDYHLAAGSPGLGVADPDTPTDVDIDGEMRPQGDGPDMGADER